MKTKTTKGRVRMVCVDCGHEVDKCGSKSICSFLHTNPYFCGNCGETGCHVQAVTVKKWQQARKIFGLSTKINSYD